MAAVSKVSISGGRKAKIRTGQVFQNLFILLLSIQFLQGSTSYKLIECNEKIVDIENSSMSKPKILHDGYFLHLKHSKYLTELDLSHCSITQIKLGAFRGVENITKLNLSDNLIEPLDPAVFKDLVKLQNLDLSRNPLGHFKTNSVFPSLPLQSLQIASCKLASVEQDLFRNLQKLVLLNLWGNHLRSIDWKVFRELKMLHSINLHNNPFYCDCNVSILVAFFEEYYINYGYESNPSFCKSFPGNSESNSNDLSNQLQRLWQDVDILELKCPPLVHLSFTTETIFYDEVPDSPQHIEREIQIKCKYSGYNEPIIQWFKNGAKINASMFYFYGGEHSRITIYPLPFDDENYDERNDFDTRYNPSYAEILRIKEAQSADSGNYTCFATNIAGNASKSVEITILKPQQHNQTKTQALHKFELTDLNLLGQGHLNPNAQFFVGVFAILMCTTATITCMIFVCVLWRRKWKIENLFSAKSFQKNNNNAYFQNHQGLNKNATGGSLIA